MRRETTMRAILFPLLLCLVGAVLLVGCNTEQVDTVKEYAGYASDATADFEQGAADATDAADLADAGVKAVAPLIPQPWGTLAAMAGTLGIGLWRAWRERKEKEAVKSAAAKVIRSVDPIVQEHLKKQPEGAKDTLRVAQGEDGRALVAEAKH